MDLMLTVFLILVLIGAILAATAIGAASYFWSARNVLAVMVKVAKRRERSMNREIRRLTSDNRFLVDELLVRNGARAINAPQTPAPNHQPRKNRPVSPTEAINRAREAEKTGPIVPGQMPETVPPATAAKFLKETTEIYKQADTAEAASATNGASGGV